MQLGIWPVLALSFAALACSPVSAPGESGDGGSDPQVDASADLCATCSEFAECVAPAGTQECRCLEGYTGDGQTCADINECDFGNGGCDASATCTNLEGAYTCTCPEGSVGDGFSCRRNLIFFANGGVGDQRFFKSFDLDSNQVQDEPLMPMDSNDFCNCGFVYHGIISAGGAMHYFANYGQSFRSDWSNTSYPMSKRRGEYGAARLDGKIYFVGGRGPIDAFDSFDPATETWSTPGQLPNYPFAVEFPAVAGLNGKLYVVGGPTGDAGSSRFFEYDPVNNGWQGLNNAPFEDAQAAGATDGNLFYVFAEGRLWAFDPNDASSGGFNQLGPLPRPNARPAVAGGNLYAVYDANNRVEIDIWNGQDFDQVQSVLGLNFGNTIFHVGGSD
jgi:hypothetical protein